MSSLSTGPGWRARVRVDGPLGLTGAPTRRSLVTATVLGLAQSATVVVQAVLVADILQRCLEHGAALADVEAQLIGLGVAVAVRGVLGWVGGWLAQHRATVVAGALRARLLDHLVALGPSWLAGERAGELTLAATRGPDAVGVYVGRYLPQLVVAVLAPLGVLAWVAATDWISVLILLGLLALVPPCMISFGRRATEATDRQWRGLSSLSAHLLELIQGLPTLRAFGRVPYGRREVAEATERLRAATLRTLRVAFLSSLSLELLAGLGTGLVAMVLGLRLLGGHTSLAVALAVILVSPEVLLPLRRASAEFHASAEGRSAAERIGAVLAQPVPAPTHPGGTPLPRPESLAVTFEAVRVELPDRSVPALGPFTLRVEAGRRAALVGPSGSGKSTALHALLGLVPLSAGRILLGPVDLQHVDLDGWRGRVAWVPQRPHLFTATLADNLRLGAPGAEDDAVGAAVALAGLTEVVAHLPEGLETVVGEGGRTLSPGERHRVAVARAVLHGGDVVLLDEIGSHLDLLAQRRLADALEGWLDGRTVIVAAHHLEAAGPIDQVVELGSDATRTPSWAGSR